MRTATIRQVQNGYVLEEEMDAPTYHYSMTVVGLQTKTTKVFTGIEETLREIVKGMVPEQKNVSIHVSV
jgi:ribosomal protein L13